MSVIHLVISPMTIIIGVMILYFQYSLFLFFYKAYKAVYSYELRIISFSFFSFIVATLLLILLNGFSYYSLYTLGYENMEFYREIGILIYNIFLAIGFLFLIILSLKTKEIERNFPLSITLILTQISLILVDGVIIIETIVLIYLYFSRGKKTMFTGKLWITSLLFILGSRVIGILPIHPLSDAFSILMDLIAFLSLYLMKLELSLKMEGKLR